MQMNDENYKKPFYEQLRDVIRNKILSGEFPPGTAIPSENALAKQYGVHRLTLRNTIQILVDEGLLVTRKGRGAFVVGEKKQFEMDQFPGYKKSLREKNTKELAEVLVNSPRLAGPYYADLFDISEQDEIHYVKRMLKTRNSPVSIEKFYIPLSLIPNMESIDFSIFSAREVLDFYNIEIHKTTETLEVVYVDYKMSKRLEVKEDTPVFLFSVIGTDNKGITVFHYENYTRSDKAEFVVSYSE